MYFNATKFKLMYFPKFLIILQIKETYIIDTTNVHDNLFKKVSSVYGFDTLLHIAWYRKAFDHAVVGTYMTLVIPVNITCILGITPQVHFVHWTVKVHRLSHATVKKIC